MSVGVRLFKMLTNTLFNTSRNVGQLLLYTTITQIKKSNKTHQIESK